MHGIVMFFAALVISAAAHAGALDGFTDHQASCGLKKTLEQGSLNALARPGKANRFLDNPHLRSALPKSVFGALGEQAY